VRIADLARFSAERELFKLAHTCESCAYRDRDREACAHGYPDATHRDAAFAPEAAEGMFCKEFELA
jgi:hypothetical protein